MGCVKQDSSAWYLQGNSFWRDQAKGWLLSPPKDQANTSTVFLFNFVSFAWQREKRERKKKFKKGNFHHESCSKGLQETNLDVGLL